MKKYLVAANWKMHMNVAQASILGHRLHRDIPRPSNTEIVLCPPYTSLQPLSRELDRKKFLLGAQNGHFVDEGTFTGEISMWMLKDLVHYVIVGHSERRAQFAEKDDVIARKVSAAVRHDISPLLCVGETFMERHDNETARVVHDQVVADLMMLTAEEVNKVVLVYEPVWAISKGDGHGENATPDQLRRPFEVIRHTVSELYGKDAGRKIRVLYGGSVNPDNVGAYLGMKDCDGFLVGGASLNHAQFAAIVRATEEHSKKRSKVIKKG